MNNVSYTKYLLSCLNSVICIYCTNPMLNSNWYKLYLVFPMVLWGLGREKFLLGKRVTHSWWDITYLWLRKHLVLDLLDELLTNKGIKLEDTQLLSLKTKYFMWNWGRKGETSHTFMMKHHLPVAEETSCPGPPWQPADQQKNREWNKNNKVIQRCSVFTNIAIVMLMCQP